MDNSKIMAAKALRKDRPPVIPGTNTIPDMAARLKWYGAVNNTVKALKLKPGELGKFCDIAGVPD